MLCDVPAEELVAIEHAAAVPSGRAAQLGQLYPVAPAHKQVGSQFDLELLQAPR